VSTITLDKTARQDLCQARVTLNGHRAQIAGYNRPFAIVTDLTTGLGAEWAWITVARIVADNGEFHS